MKSIVIKNHLKEKLRTLVFFLYRSESNLGQVAEEVGDAKLKTALNGLAAESCEFAIEISLQLRSHGIVMNEGFNNIPYEIISNNSTGTKQDVPGGELMQYCEKIEKMLTTAYRDLLEELHIPVPFLKELLQIQLNSLKNAFLRVKLMNVARFTA